MIRSRSKLLAVLTGTMLAAAATLALTGALAAASPGSGEIPSAEITAPSTEQVAAFPVLGQSAKEADSVVRSAAALEALQEAQARYAANPSLGRVAAETPAGTVAVVPGEGVVCLLVLQAGEQAGSFCEPNAVAASEGLGVRADINEEHYALLGVFPASVGASDLRLGGATGVETPVELSPQSGYAVETGARPVELRWRAAGGAQRSRTLIWPPVRKVG